MVLNLLLHYNYFRLAFIARPLLTMMNRSVYIRLARFITNCNLSGADFPQYKTCDIWNNSLFFIFERLNFNVCSVMGKVVTFNVWNN